MATRLVSSTCWGGVKWHSLRLCTAMVAILIAANTRASAQEPYARLLAAKGLQYTEGPVRETDVAAGTNRVMALHMQRSDIAWSRVGYAFATPAVGPRGPEPPQHIPIPWRWDEEGEVPLGETDRSSDPSVAYDSVTGNFLLAAQTTPGRTAYPILGRYNSALGDFDWNGWKFLEFADQSPVPGGDKPWLVAGEIIPGNPAQQEFYICYTGAGSEMGHLIWARSVDGGDNWYGGVADPPGLDVEVSYVHCAAHPDGSLYVAYFYEGPNHFRFLHGQDPASPEQPMTWEYLDTDLDPYNGVLDVPAHVNALTTYLPLPGLFTVHVFPNLAVDPLDPNNLYLVYHDTVEAPPPVFEDVDVDVFLQKLTEQEDGTWTVGNRVPVNDPDPNDPPPATPSDQFFPGLTVDPLGRIHVIFYDDRDFEYQQDIPPAEYPKFNVYYAYSENGGLSFPEPDRELYQIPEETALDYAVVEGQGTFTFQDYSGITWQTAGQGYRIWTTFTGTHGDDPTEHDSVIYSSQIPWPPP